MKRLIFIIALGLFAVSTIAQETQTTAVYQQARHEISIWGAGGISSLQYSLDNGGEHQIGFGGFAGIGYNYFFNYNWSIGTGAEFSYLTAKGKIPMVSDYYQTIDNTSTTPFILNIEGKDYEESQMAMYINIPLMVKYQVDVWKQHKFYAAIGPKIGIPFRAEYKAEGNITTSATLPVNGTNPGTRDRIENIPSKGFSTYQVSSDGDLELDLNYMAAAEAGMKWHLGKYLSLYTGLYFDYGLNNILKGDDSDFSKNFYEYNRETPTSYTVNSLLVSKYNDNAGEYVERMNTLSAGVKVQLAFGLGFFDKKERQKEKPATAEEVDKIMMRNTQSIEQTMDRNTGEIRGDMQKQTDEILTGMDKTAKEIEANRMKERIMKDDPNFTGTIAGFDLSKNEILPSMRTELDRKVALMKKYPQAKIILEGHTDDLGSDEYNMQLGLQRAEAAKAYMVSKGVDESRMVTTSKGKSQPIYPNANGESRSLNRRVEFILQ